MPAASATTAHVTPAPNENTQKASFAKIPRMANSRFGTILNGELQSPGRGRTGSVLVCLASIQPVPVDLARRLAGTGRFKRLVELGPAELGAVFLGRLLLAGAGLGLAELVEIDRFGHGVSVSGKFRQSSIELCPHLWPFPGEDRQDHRRPQKTARDNPVVAQHAFLNRAKLANGCL